MKTLRTMVAALLTVAAIAACGQADRDSDDAEGALDTAAGAGSSPDASPPPEEAFPVDATFWHSGFQVELSGGVISAGVDELTGGWRRLLAVDARFTNLGPDESAFRPDLVVVAGSDHHQLAVDAEIPAVPGGLTGEGRLVFEVADGFPLDTAYLLVGRNGDNQARVPLGAQGGELVDLAPRELAVSGTASLPEVDVTVTSAELRADVPVNYTEVAQGRLALTLHLAVTSRKSGNWGLHAQDFALILPTGTAVGVDGRQLGSLPGTDAGVQTDGLYVRFLVPDPPDGEYTLRFAPGSYWLGPGDPEEATFSFTL